MEVSEANTTDSWNYTEQNNFGDMVTEPISLPVRAHWDVDVGLGICVIGLLLDIATIISIVRRMKPNSKRQQTYFLINVLACDIVIASAGLVLFALRRYQYNHIGETDMRQSVEKSKLKSYFLCAQHMSIRISMAGCFANLIALLLMTIDHFVAVRFSLKHHIWMRKRVIFSCIAIAWVTALLLGLADFFLILSKETKLRKYVAENYNAQLGGFCHIEVVYRYYNEDGIYEIPVGQEQDDKFKDLLHIVMVSVVFVTLVCVYSYIAHVVMKVSKARAKRQKQAQVPEKEVNQQIRKQRIKGIGTTVLFLLTFIILWLPGQVVKFLEITESEALEIKNLPEVNTILTVITSSTSLVDVLVYFLRSRELKKIKKSWSCSRKMEEPRSSNQTASKATFSTHL